jgi:hypothetical protein
MEDNVEEVVEEVVTPEETTTENLEEVDTNEVASESVEEVQEEAEKASEDDINKQIEERANALFEEKVQKRLARDRASRERKFNKEISKYKHLESVINAGLGVDNVDDAIERASAFYKDQGINIPEFKDEDTVKREKRLAKLEAEDIIELGREEMESEANRLAKIPIEKMSTYEKTVFDTICERLTEDNQTQALKEKGIDPSILKDENFRKFKNQFNISTPITDIYDMFQLKVKPIEKPASAGSAKSENTINNDTLTLEKISKMTPQEMAKYWDNPEFKRLVGV